jgi:hypothetical protein
MRSIAAVSVGVVALAAAAFTGAASAAAGSHHAPPSVMINCFGHGVQHPTSYVLACADGNAELIHNHWQHWGSAAATARATLSLNLCQPNCAQGTFRDFPVNVTVDHRRVHSGRGVYRRLSYTIIGPVPHGVLRHVTDPLPA